MIEMTDIVDKYIYQSVKELKNILCINTKKIFIFPQRIVNKQKIIENTELIMKKLFENMNELNKYIINFSNKN